MPRNIAITAGDSIANPRKVLHLPWVNSRNSNNESFFVKVPSKSNAAMLLFWFKSLES